MGGHNFFPKPEARSSTGHCSEELSYSHSLDRWSLGEPSTAGGETGNRDGKIAPTFKILPPRSPLLNPAEQPPWLLPIQCQEPQPLPVVTTRHLSASPGEQDHPPPHTHTHTHCLCPLGALNPAHPILCLRREHFVGCWEGFWCTHGLFNKGRSHACVCWKHEFLHVCVCPWVNTGTCKQPLQVPWNGTLESPGLSRIGLGAGRCGGLGCAGQGETARPSPSSVCTGGQVLAMGMGEGEGPLSLSSWHRGLSPVLSQTGGQLWTTYCCHLP